MSRRFLRSLRNISASPVEVKIKNATNNDSFGPTTTELNEVAILTFQSTEATRMIITILSKRLRENSSKNHRHLLKCLTVIEYVLLTGNSAEFVKWLQEEKYLMTTLKEYQMQNNEEIARKIRNKSKIILKLLANPELLEEKRSNFHIFRNKMYEPAVNKRSSLDITGEDRSLTIITDNLPLQLQRGAKSFEIARSYSDGPDSSESPCSPTTGKFRREMDKLLADISEE